jgi:glycosyltransferase involved in cell wall biosynthesis
MRILIIDKTAGLDSSHLRHQAIAKQPDVELHVLGPRHWIESGRDIRWNPDNPDYHAIPGKMFFKDYYARSGYYSGLCRAIASAKPDIIQILEEPWSISALQTVLAASVFAPNALILFYTWENIYRDWTYPAHASRLYAMIDKLSHRRSAAAVCATKCAMDVLQKKGYSKKTAVIPYGIPDYFLDDVQTDVKDQHPFTLGYIGRIMHMKGIDLLLESVKSIPDARLIIIGSGGDEEHYQQWCVNHDIQDRVEWRPPIAEHQVPELMDQFDAFVLPSRSTPGWMEQLGRCAIEAMARQIPVIGSTSGAIPEVIGNAGLVFKEGSVESLIEQILILRNNENLRHELGQKGRQRVQQQFTWDRFASNICNFYRTLI